MSEINPENLNKLRQGMENSMKKVYVTMKGDVVGEVPESTLFPKDFEYRGCTMTYKDTLGGFSSLIRLGSEDNDSYFLFDTTEEGLKNYFAHFVDKHFNNIESLTNKIDVLESLMSLLNGEDYFNQEQQIDMAATLKIWQQEIVDELNKM